MKILKLNKGIVKVDDEDFDLISRYHWYNNHGYALNETVTDGKKVRLRMHRLILGKNAGKYTDHINGDKLDNQKHNLRACSNAQNMRNIPPKRQNSSGFKGVTWQKDCSRWKAQIKVDYKNIHIGIFKDKIDAARAYNNAAKIYFGEYAWLNTI